MRPHPARGTAVSTSATGTRDDHPDLVPPVRDLLHAWGGSYVIENVPGAPLENPVVVCGWAMGLDKIKRHRLFESNLPLMSPGCMCPNRRAVSIFGNAADLYVDGVRTHVPFAQARALMGCDWMTRREDVADAIPPAYTEYLGEQIAAHLRSTAA